MSYSNNDGFLRHFFSAGMLCWAACSLAGCGAATGTPAAAVPESVSAEPTTSAAVKDSAVNDSVDTDSAKSDSAAKAGLGSAEQETETSTDEARNNRATSVAASSGEITEITFDDLKCNMQEDVVFRPWMLTDRARELDGRRIRVVGFMLPYDKQDGIVDFVLLRNSECKFGPGGKADHLIQVSLQGGVTASYKGDRPMEVVGTLKINPFLGADGNTWCIYDVAGESVKWKRR